jgi:hypothetical protein
MKFKHDMSSGPIEGLVYPEEKLLELSNPIAIVIIIKIEDSLG